MSGLGGDGDSSALRFASTRGRTGSSSDFGLQYPSPFFDIGQTYLPATVKQMFRWCRYYFFVNPLINAVVSKMADYPITDIILDTEKQDLKDSWNEFLNEQLRYRPFQIEVGLDYFAYGNSLVSIFYPFVKMLRCTRCGFEKQASDAIYRFMNFEFHWQCEQCDHSGIAKVRDHYIKAPKGIRLLRWNPEDVDIRFNDISGEYEYYYSIPVQLKNDIIIGKKSSVESVPQLFIDALRLRKAVVFSRDNIYHFKRPTLAGKDRGWGTPLILPVLKDCYYLQILRKAQEAICLEHIVPLRVLFPQAGSATSDPFCVALDSFVETRDGIKPAGEVQQGEFMKNHHGEWEPVKCILDRPIQPGEKSYEFTIASLSAFPFKVSEEHPLLAVKRPVPSRGYDGIEEPDFIQAQSIEKGDFVCYPRRRMTWDRLELDLHDYHPERAFSETYVYRRLNQEAADIYEYLEENGVPEFKHRDKAAFLEEHGWSDQNYLNARNAFTQSESIDRISRFLPVTADLAYLIGLYAAEGCPKDTGVSLSLNSAEEDIMDRVDSILVEMGFQPGNRFTRASQHSTQYDIGDIFLGGLLVQLCGKGAVNKHLPRVITEAPDHIALRAVEGVLAGDGCSFNTSTRREGLKTVSPQLAVDVRTLLLSFGLIATVQKAIPSPDERAKLPYYQVNLNGSQADEYCALIQGKAPQIGVSRCGFIRGDYVYLRVNNRREAPEVKTVRGFQMSRSKSFCVVGVATHNTTINLQDWHDQIAGEIRRWRCVTPESLVEAREGLRPAREIRKGDYLKNRNGTFEQVSEVNLRPLDAQEQAYRIHARGLAAVDTVFSEEHPIWAARSFNKGNGHKLGVTGFVPVADLRVGDYVGYPVGRDIKEISSLDLAEYTNKACTEQHVYIDHYKDSEVPEIFEYLSDNPEISSRQDLLSEKGWGLNAYKIAQMAIREQRVLRRLPRHIPFDVDLATVVGLYLAEGSVTRKQVFFALHEKETDYIDQLNRIFKEKFGCSEGIVHYIQPGKPGIQLVFSSVIAAQLLAELCPGTARTKRIPEVYRHANEDIVLALVRGMVCGDGCEYARKVTWSSVSLQMAEDFRQLLISLGIMAGISSYETPPSEINGRAVCSTILYTVQTSGTYSDLFKYKMGWADVPPDKLWSHIGVFDGGYLWHRVNQIDKVDATEVIGFGMRGDHTFCTWGVATHNSDNAYIPILPLPIGQETIGGDGRALLLTQEIRVWSEHIVAGMGVPNEIIFGGLSYCQSPDTLLFTSHGLETLEELTPASEGQGTSDRKVVSHLGTRDVLRTHHVGLKKAAWAKTRLGLELTGAHTHPVYVLQPDLTTVFKTMEELKPGDRVAVKAGANLWPKDAPKIEFQTTNTGNRFEDVTFPKELTPELARLLGYLVAEGSCTEPRRIGFGNSDQEVNTDFADCVEAVFGYRPKFWLNTSMPASNKPFYQTEISRQQATEFLYSLGIGGYAEEKTVPKIIRCAPKHLVAEFLKAYFEGDGGPEDVEGKQAVTACSKSGRLLQELQLLMLNMGIVTSRYFPGARPLFVLQARSEYVDIFAKEIGFVSSYKKKILSQRTPTKGSSCFSSRIPYLKERLEEFRDRHFDGRSSWKFEPIEAELTQETYTVDDIAAIVDRDRSTIQLHIQSGALKATKQPPVQGRFGGYIISRQDLDHFFRYHGLGRRRTTPKSFWGMNYEKLARKDLSFIQEKEPEFAKRITDLVESHLVWDEVQDIDLLDAEIPMRDLTVDEASTYQGNGIISHNSGSNVSLRMLENMFLGYLSDQLSLLRWVIDRTASYLNWAKVGARFKPFKMADDLQRKAYLFQLNQAGKMSDESLLADADYDSAKEDKIMELEASRRVAAMKKQRLLQAEMEGEAMLVTAKWQNKAQAKAMVEQAAIQTEAAKEQMAFQSQMQNGMMQNQVAAQTGQPPPQQSPDMSPTPRNPSLISPPKEITSPLTLGSIQQHPASATNSDIAGGMNVDLLYVARQLADRISKLTPAEKPITLRRLQERSPELHDTVVGLMMSGANGPTAASAASARALPGQKPPQRGPEAALL